MRGAALRRRGGRAGPGSGARLPAHFDRDPLHRGLVSQSGADGPGAAAASILSPDHPAVTFHLGDGGGGASFATFIREGVHHIWTGYDHLLFLLALLLPAVLWRSGDGWQPQPSFPRALKQVARTIVLTYS